MLQRYSLLGCYPYLSHPLLFLLVICLTSRLYKGASKVEFLESVGHRSLEKKILFNFQTLFPTMSTLTHLYLFVCFVATLSHRIAAIDSASKILSGDAGSITITSTFFSIRAGELKTVSVRVCNSGSTTWPKGGLVRLGAGHRRGYENELWWSGLSHGGYMKSFLNGRAFLPRQLTRNECATVHIDVFVDYHVRNTVTFSVKMVRDGAHWFGATALRRLRVDPSDCQFHSTLDMVDFLFHSSATSANTLKQFEGRIDGKPAKYPDGAPIPIRSVRNNFRSNGFFIVKSDSGAEYEKLYYDGNFVYLMQDTSWDAWMAHCPKEAYFEYISDTTGKPGGEVFPRFITYHPVSKVVGRGFKVVGKNENGSNQCEECYRSAGGQKRTIRTCFRKEKTFSRTGAEVADVLEIQLTGGPGGAKGNEPGERYFYGRGKGWIGFEGARITSHYITTDDPREFSPKEICPSTSEPCSRFSRNKSCDQCIHKHGNVQACNATPGCAYYYCSRQCHKRGTSNCQAGCSQYCNLPKRCPDSHGNVKQCNATNGCAYYYCSKQCHKKGTSNCSAGCSTYCNVPRRCSDSHGNVQRCNATSGCAYYYCSRKCYKKGTSNCNAGCSQYCRVRPWWHWWFSRRT